MTDTQNITQEITLEQELETLQSLKEQGILSQTDFDKATSKLRQKAKESGINLEPMGIIKTYFHSWKNIFNFKGRATRSEFFLFTIVNGIILQLIPVIFEWAFSISLSKNTEITTSFILSLLTLSVYIRRFHDTNRSGIVPTILTLGSVPMLYFSPIIKEYTPSLTLLCLYLLIALIYCVLVIYAFMITLFKGTQGWNKYGKAHTSKPHVKYSIIGFFILILFTPIIIGAIAGYQTAIRNIDIEHAQIRQEDAKFSKQWHKEFIQDMEVAPLKQDNASITIDTQTAPIETISNQDVVLEIEKLENDSNTTLDTKETQEAVDIVNDFSNETPTQNNNAQTQSTSNMIQSDI